MDIKYLIPEDKEEANQYETWYIDIDYEHSMKVMLTGAVDIVEILTWKKERVPSEFAIAMEGEEKIKRAKAWFLKSLEEDQIFLNKEIQAYEEYKEIEEARFYAYMHEQQEDIDKHIPLNV